MPPTPFPFQGCCPWSSLGQSLCCRGQYWEEQRLLLHCMVFQYSERNLKTESEKIYLLNLILKIKTLIYLSHILSISPTTHNLVYSLCPASPPLINWTVTLPFTLSFLARLYFATLSCHAGHLGATFKLKNLKQKLNLNEIIINFAHIQYIFPSGQLASKRVCYQQGYPI